MHTQPHQFSWLYLVSYFWECDDSVHFRNSSWLIWHVTLHFINCYRWFFFLTCHKNEFHISFANEICALHSFLFRCIFSIVFKWRCEHVPCALWKAHAWWVFEEYALFVCAEWDETRGKKTTTLKQQKKARKLIWTLNGDEDDGNNDNVLKEQIIYIHNVYYTYVWE